MIDFGDTVFGSLPDPFAITREPMEVDLPEPPWVRVPEDGNVVISLGDIGYEGMSGRSRSREWSFSTKVDPLCAGSRCPVKTSSPSGYCPIHEYLAPSAPEWVPGTVHPTGGYDEVVITGLFREGTSYRYRGELHRLDGPARVTRQERQWWVNGQRHRLDGPAVELWFGLVGDRYFLLGRSVSKPAHPRVAEAVAAGAPLEWALAYADGADE